MKLDQIIKKIKRKFYFFRIRTFYKRKADKFYNSMVEEARKENSLFIVLTPLIGDTIYGMAYIEEIKKKNPQKKIIVVGSKKLEGIISTYPCVDEFRLIDTKRHGYDPISLYLWSSEKANEGLRVGIYNSMPLFYANLKDKQDPDILKLLREDVYELRKGATITYHHIPRKPIEAIINYSEIKDRIVLINPYSNSVLNGNYNLYEKLTAWLRDNGYFVFTNVVGNQKAIVGSTPLRCTLEELYSIACDIPLIISVRSGILDLIITSNVNMLVFYETKGNRFNKAYHLESWKCKGKIVEAFFDEKDHSLEEQTLYELLKRTE